MYLVCSHLPVESEFLSEDSKPIGLVKLCKKLGNYTKFEYASYLYMLYDILDIDEHRSLIFFYYPILLKKLIEAKGHKNANKKRGTSLVLCQYKYHIVLSRVFPEVC